MRTRKHKPHIVPILTLSLVWLILSANAAASDWFVRPAGGNYGSEDGSSYQDAWDGLLNVVWGPGGVQPGDNLYVSGLHIYEATEWGNLGTQADITPVSGTDDSTRVTIRGDCSSVDASYADGVIWGSCLPTYAGSVVQQSPPNDDVWRFYLNCTQNNKWFFEDVTIEGYNRLASRQWSVADCQSNDGSFYWDSTNKYLYVNPFDDSDPTGRILIEKYGYDFKLDGLSYITFKDIDFYSSARMFTDESDGSEVMTYIEWNGCTLAYAGHSLLSFQDNSHYNEVIDCELHHASNGIYNISQGNDAPSNYVYSGNYIHDIGNDPQTYNGDAHAISPQGGTNGLIEYNYCLRAGNAILLYASSMQELKDTIVRYNYVKDTHTSGGNSNGKGISAQTSNHGLSDKTGNKFYGNILHSINSYGFYLQFEDEQKVYNNVMYDCLIGIGTARNVIVIEFDNGTEEFSKYDSIANGLGATATVDGLEQSGTSPNITGRLALDNKVGAWSDNDNIQIGGVTRAQVDGDQYNLGAHITARNNIILNSRYKHVDFVASTMARYIENFDYNLYYPDTGTKFGRGHNDYDFAEWQALSKTGSTFDPHSIVADPLFVDPENGNFHLWSDSPAINAGVDVGLTQDFDGNPVPQGPAPDIGAYESVVDPSNPTPVLQAIGNKSVNENVTLTFDINATDPDSEPITYSVQSLPSGAAFSGQTFSWTPSYDQAGSYQVRYIASDGNSNDSETITITVNNVNRAPVLGSIADQSVNETALLSFPVNATDADGQTITYSVSGLPTGAVFASKTFTWTPSYDQAGEYSVTFTADDGQAQDSETITITVVNVNRAPVLTAIGNRTAYADVLLTFTIDATDPDGGAITYSTGTLPSGATFTGQDFDWTPIQSQVGSYAVTFIASDGQLQDSEDVTLIVDVDSLAPTVTNLSPTDESIQVPLNNLITLNITDAGIGVEADSVKIKVRINDNPNNDTVYFGDTDHYTSPEGDCRRLGTKADYRFVYQPTNEMLYYDQTVTITVNATDLAGNVMNSYSYSFATEMHSFGQNKQVNLGLDNNDRPVTVYDSSGNIWTAWHAGSVGSRDIYVSKLAAGEENFGGTVQLTNNTTDQCNPAVALDSNDKLYVVWQDNREGDWDIYVSTSIDGISWSTEIRVNDPNIGNQINPAVVIDGQNYAHVVWQDDRAGNQDICIATSSDGFATKTVSQITSDSFDQIEPAIAADSDNTIYVVWTDGRNGSNDIYGAASNNPWTNVAIVSNTNNQSSPAIATESTGSILHLLWVDDTSGDNDIYYASSDGLPGSPLTGSSIIDDSSGADQLNPSIVVAGSTDNNLKVFACWQDWRNTDTDLYFAELSAGSGTNVFVDDGGSNADQGEPAIGIGEYNHPYLIWADRRSTNTDIYYAGSTFIEPVALASELITASAPSSTIVGTDPQAITTVDDVSIVVPAGACSYDVAITLTKIVNLPAFAAPCLGGYDFGPSGIQFSQPVTITIPYVFSGSDGSAKPYWFNLLTGMLSQQGITDIQDIPVSPSLHALSFKTTHFTAFYLFAGGGGAAAIIGGGGGGGGCSVSASGEGNIIEYILPYIGLAVVMAILKMRDSRYRKARNMTTGKC